LVAILALLIVGGLGVLIGTQVAKDGDGDGASEKEVVFPDADCKSSAAEPQEVILACADVNFVAKELSWNDWGDDVADAHGTAELNNCIPDCADGSFESYEIRLIASAIATCPNGERRYTRLTFEFPGGSPLGGEDVPQERDLSCPRA
jgi:hypothetical protein